MAFDPISAGISLVGGLFGAASSSSAQSAARRDSQKLAEFEYKTNVRNWKYSKKTRRYEYKQALRIFRKSKDVYGRQLGLNQAAAARSYEAENRKLEEYLQGLSFQKQDGFIQMLQARGAATETAGQSSARLSNNILSQYGRNNAVLAENLISAYNQHEADLENINLQKQSADLEAFSRLGLMPQKPPEPPKPRKAPVGGGSANPLLSIGSTIMQSVAAGYSAANPK